MSLILIQDQSTAGRRPSHEVSTAPHSGLLWFDLLPPPTWCLSSRQVFSIYQCYYSFSYELNVCSNSILFSIYHLHVIYFAINRVLLTHEQNKWLTKHVAKCSLIVSKRWIKFQPESINICVYVHIYIYRHAWVKKRNINKYM